MLPPPPKIQTHTQPETQTRVGLLYVYTPGAEVGHILRRMYVMIRFELSIGQLCNPKSRTTLPIIVTTF